MAAPPASAEIQAAVSYLISHLSPLALSPSTQAKLATHLSSTLQARYDSHWHLSDPERGSAYRALTRSASSLDQLLVKSFKASDIPLREACKALAASMACDKWTLWIDPGCVSIRMHGGISHFDTASSSSSSSNKMNMSGIIEIWGKLPSSLTGIMNATITGTTSNASVGHAVSGGINRPKTPAASSKLNDDEAAVIAAEFEALALNASPMKKTSKAVAIMKPVVHKGIASIASSSDSSSPINQAAVATPPRPLPPLCFTIQESTSPYVPSFAAQAHQSDNASTTSSSGNTITRGVTPSLLGALPSPLAMGDNAASPPASSPSSASSSGSTSDPFARPSSRSSTTSLGSATSCSIFSHASSDSRSSSIGSFISSDEAAEKANTTITALTVPKASPGEMDAAKCFTFPGKNGNAALKADTLALLPQSSAPNSPSKPTRRRHDRSASIVSAASSSNDRASSTSSSGRRPSSRNDIRVEKETEAKVFSNGTVKVLGGGVMLGPAKKDTSSSSSNNHKRNHSTASSANGTSLNVTRTNSRPPKVRTTSSSSSISSSSYDHHHHQYNAFAHPQQYQHYNHNAQQQFSNTNTNNNNWAHYPAPPAQIPQQYRY